MNQLERAVHAAWMDLPFRHFGVCATCGRLRGDDDRPLLVAGLNHDSQVCVECFDSEHGGRAPNYRRRRVTGGRQLQIVPAREGEPMNELRVMSSLGDEIVAEWDPADEAEVASARAKFAELVEQGYVAYEALETTPRRGGRVEAFDPAAEKLLFALAPREEARVG